VIQRALLVCPGRGSYARETLGVLRDRSPAAQQVIAACDAWREAHGRPTISSLDAAAGFSSRQHVAGENASLLTFAASLADAAELSERYEVVGVTGNSMGWYTALAVAGALPLEHAIELVDTMGSYQQDHVVGAQLIYPLTGDDWLPDPARRATVDRALQEVREQGHGAWWSIDLGAFAVLGADEAGARALTQLLPPEQRGPRPFPARLPLHSAFHTPLLQPTSDRARAELAHLAFQRPRVPLIDSTGHNHRPLSADPEALRRYTLGAQVVEPFDFSLAVRAALYHTAPDVVILLGPGNSLGAPVASVLVQAGWHGQRTRAQFEAAQRSSPYLLAFGREEQRALLR
jgi:[acyl-carrier-protein] S-malonyltransferase